MKREFLLRPITFCSRIFPEPVPRLRVDLSRSSPPEILLLTTLACDAILRNQMVTHSPHTPAKPISPDVYHAIADPTRRAILDRLRGGPAAVNALASDFSQSRPAISRHLRVLRTAHLVRERRCGRERRYSLEPEPLRDVAQWIEEYRAFWQSSLTNLKRHLEKERGGSE